MPQAHPDHPLISLVVPCHNEAGNVSALYGEVQTAMATVGRPWEIVFVDDGSSDGTVAELEALAARDPRVTVVVFRRNYGQTAALSAGFREARGDLLVPLDADLQNDPADIPRLLAELEATGADVVSGWRKERHDPPLRVLVSRTANLLVSWLSGVRLHDYGCTLKVYRADVLRDVQLFGEMHRFIPVYAYWQGARIRELVVNHRPRQRGASKYGFSRIFKVPLDLLTLKLLGDYSTKPIYLFGKLSALLFAFSMLALLLVIYDKLALGLCVTNNVKFIISVFAFSFGLQFITLGLLAELIMRAHHEVRGRGPYEIRRTLRTGAGPTPSAPPPTAP